MKTFNTVFSKFRIAEFGMNLQFNLQSSLDGACGRAAPRV